MDEADALATALTLLATAIENMTTANATANAAAAAPGVVAPTPLLNPFDSSPPLGSLHVLLDYLRNCMCSP